MSDADDAARWRWFRANWRELVFYTELTADGASCVCARIERQIDGTPGDPDSIDRALDAARGETLT